jgi:serine/threonine protein kinase
MHSLNVIHRDIKCDNIFINGNDGKVLIGDLGLSTILHGEGNCAASIVGTPEFMAPELFNESYGTPVDIYSFGMCLLEISTRKFPYSECPTAAQVYRSVINHQPPASLLEISNQQLKALICRCIVSEPSNRPTAAELLQDDFWLCACAAPDLPVMPRLPDLEVTSEGPQKVRFDFYPELDTPEIMASELVAQGIAPDSPGLPGRIKEAVRRVVSPSPGKASDALKSYMDFSMKASSLATGRLLDGISSSFRLDRKALEVFLGLGY